MDSQELELILETMADGVLVVDANRTVRRWNRGMERLTGFSREEAVGKPCAGGICRLFAAGSLDRAEITITRKNGQTIPVIASARLMQGPGHESLGAVVTMTDISTVRNLQEEIFNLRREIGDRYEFHNIVGRSPAMQQVFTLIELAAASTASILICGETGTGKELVARAIHHHSDRADQPLVTVNCSALSETLVESELFGHVRGAFTGAVKDYIGRFERADGGAIFLDEVGEIPQNVQVKLLRVIQEREIERIGDSQPRKVNVRIMAATHRDLRERVEQGKFREDLFYRLNVFPIHLTPLRNRREDIQPLVDHFIRKFNEKSGKKVTHINRDAMRMINDYCWPGNVRELENAIEHAFVTCLRTEINPPDLPIEIRRADIKERICNRKATLRTPERIHRKPVQKDELLSLLQECSWNKAEVARRLGITRTHVWRKMTQLGIPLSNVPE